MQKELYRQHTLKREIRMIGIEPYGGNPVKVTMRPADPDTGIVFKTTDGQSVKAEEKYFKTSGSFVRTMLLKGKNLNIRGLEHDLGTEFVYQIDNLTTEIEIDPKLTYRLFKWFGEAKNTAVIPYYPDLQRSLCDRIEEVGIAEQNAPRKTLRLKKREELGNERLKLEHIEGDDVIIKAITQYKLSNGDVVNGEKEIKLTPKEYKPIANARPFFGAPIWAPNGLNRKSGRLYGANVWLPKILTRFIGKFLYLSYGFGHGIDETKVFYPPRSEEEWRKWEIMKDEVACHSIVDRAGDTIKRLEILFGAKACWNEINMQVWRP